ncbi:MAG: hypothetical protein JRJ59_00895 [Deltaproteobacteria bacterium]|nr:hypothetical protein [Deltaproteobacteria bacterium]
MPGQKQKRLLVLFLILLALLLGLDFLIDKHAHLAFEELPGFFAACGFLSGPALILAARVLRRLVSRSEDYDHD